MKETMKETIKSVIIEKQEYPHMIINDHNVPVTWNFGSKESPENIVGEAKVIKDDVNKYYTATITLFDSELSKSIAKLMETSNRIFPAVGCSHVIRNESGNVISCKLTEVSICTNNVDKTIPPIKLF